MKNISFIIFLFYNIIISLPYNIYSQTNRNDSLKVSITQTISSGPNQVYNYLLKNDSLFVLETKDGFYGNNYYGYKTTTIFRKQIPKADFGDLYAILDSIFLSKIDSVYSQDLDDGVAWDFEIVYKKTTIKTYLSNYYIPELDKLLMFLNSELPTNSQMISFEVFGVKKEFTKKKKK